MNPRAKSLKCTQLVNVTHWMAMAMDALSAAASMFLDVSKYVGHLSHGFTPVTALSERCMVTYRHGDHATWRVGDEFEVRKCRARGTGLDLKCPGPLEDIDLLE